MKQSEPPNCHKHYKTNKQTNTIKEMEMEWPPEVLETRSATCRIPASRKMWAVKRKVVVEALNQNWKLKLKDGNESESVCFIGQLCVFFAAQFPIFVGQSTFWVWIYTNLATGTYQKTKNFTLSRNFLANHLFFFSQWEKKRKNSVSEFHSKQLEEQVKKNAKRKIVN